jgi:alkylhydroperoxidase family enzyme
VRVEPLREHELLPVRALAHAPELLRAYAALGRFVSGETELTRGVRALAMQLAAVRAGCDWCVDYGLRPDRAVDERKLRKVADYAASDLYDDSERAALAVADEMAVGGRVADETWAEAARHFTERQLVELVGAVAAEVFFNRVNLALDVPAQGFGAVPQT